jgi:hypothetical protein
MAGWRDLKRTDKDAKTDEKAAAEALTPSLPSTAPEVKERPTLSEQVILKCVKLNALADELKTQARVIGAVATSLSADVASDALNDLLRSIDERVLALYNFVPESTTEQPDGGVVQPEDRESSDTPSSEAVSESVRPHTEGDSEAAGDDSGDDISHGDGEEAS